MKISLSLSKIRAYIPYRGLLIGIYLYILIYLYICIILETPSIE
nr:MAG TPA: hypothetical protein [Herelleviridae sp.]